MRIVKIVLTGGPCAGKTTAMSWILNNFEKLGWKVFVVGEAATELMTAGIYPKNFNDPLEFQKLLIATQVQKEDSYTLAAEKLKDAEKVLIVSDRGVCDNRAYMSNSEFLSVLGFFNLELEDAFSRYDAVFHLVTAADGAAEFYTLGNNAVRSEGLEEAIRLDKQTQNAWVGHPHLRIIKNEGAFEEKLKNLLAEISQVLGEPKPFEIERKFLIERPNPKLLEKMPNAQKVEILQTYLKSSPYEEVRVRQRGMNGSYTFTKTTKQITGDPRRRIEQEKRISGKEYLRLLMDADQSYHSIRKTRYCILERKTGQYFEIDFYPGEERYAILEIELSDPDTKISIPDYLKVVREVTNDGHYRNYHIALHGGKLPE